MQRLFHFPDKGGFQIPQFHLLRTAPRILRTQISSENTVPDTALPRAAGSAKGAVQRRHQPGSMIARRAQPSGGAALVAALPQLLNGQGAMDRQRQGKSASGRWSCSSCSNCCKTAQTFWPFLYPAGSRRSRFPASVRRAPLPVPFPAYCCAAGQTPPSGRKKHPPTRPPRRGGGTSPPGRGVAWSQVHPSPQTACFPKRQAPVPVRCFAGLLLGWSSLVKSCCRRSARESFFLSPLFSWVRSASRRSGASSSSRPLPGFRTKCAPAACIHCSTAGSSRSTVGG